MHWWVLLSVLLDRGIVYFSIIIYNYVVFFLYFIVNVLHLCHDNILYTCIYCMKIDNIVYYIIYILPSFVLYQMHGTVHCDFRR